MARRTGTLEGLEMKSSFWPGKRVFLTGHTGFKGSWLSLWLQSMGAEATGYALPPSTSPNLFTLAKVASGMRSLEGDVADAGSLGKALESARPEVVIHMAAQPLVRRSYQDPVGTYLVNVMGTINVLESVRRAGGVRAIVVVTTDKCYENRGLDRGYREDDALGGHDPYSSSKACAEMLTASFRDSFFPPAEYGRHGTAVATVRAGNVIGGGDWAEDRLVPDLMRAFSAGRTPLIRYPDAVRPWQHVMEPLSGYLDLAEKLCVDGPSYSGAWNFGPDIDGARSVGWIAGRLASLWGDGVTWARDAQDHPHEARTLKLDCSKARSLLSWLPRWGLEDALERIVSWYKSYGGGGDMRAETLRQISEYLRGESPVRGG